ncbi:MAG: hypothetical protein ABL931_19820, partial [Usitatibacteraceae bacterium]
MIGLLVGAVIGGSMHGFYGAMWGATIGFLGALLLARKNNPAEKSAKDDRLERLEKLIAHTQKAVEDIHWRLNKLEDKAGIAAKPVVDGSPPPVSAAPATAAAIAAEAAASVAPVTTEAAPMP